MKSVHTRLDLLEPPPVTLKICGSPASRAILPIRAAEEPGLPYENIPLHYASEEVKAACSDQRQRQPFAYLLHCDAIPRRREYL